MAQTIAEGNDPARVSDAISNARVHEQGLIQSLSGDLKLPLNGGLEQRARLVICKAFASRELHQQLAGFSDIEKVLANLKPRHRAAPGFLQQPA